MKGAVAMLAVVAAVTAFGAAPAAKQDPVAEGYPVWQGAVAKNYVSGREICASDLRHKVTIVIDFEPNDALQAQFVQAAVLVQMSGLGGHGWDWEARPVLPRDAIVVLSNRGTAKDSHEKIRAAFGYKGEDQSISTALRTVGGMACSIYDDVTFEGGPDRSGKRPYVYVMGPTGTTPVFQGAMDAKGIADAKKAANAELKKLTEAENKWQPFYGNIPEPQFYPQLAKTIAKGKPLKPVEIAILKDVVSKDEAKAKEAQVLFDALEQTRSDIAFRIRMEAAACPHRAYYDLQQLIRYWPGEKKKLAAIDARIKSTPEIAKLAQVFSKLMTWEDPNFMCKNAGEAKKIVLELKKMKKDIEKMKESKITVVQDGSSLMEMHIDTLIELIPTRVPEK